MNTPTPGASGPLYRKIDLGSLVQHIDNRQGRVVEISLRIGRLPAARVKWFSGPEEVIPLGYIWTTNIEETD